MLRKLERAIDERKKVE
jgi:hypothetical protein